MTDTQTEFETFTISTYEQAREVYRQRDLRQALYDAGEVVMGDVLVNLHGIEHRDRRRLENRLYSRETFEHYERDLFPPIMEATLGPHIAAGRAELVKLGHQLMMNLAAFSSGVDRPRGTPEETFHLYDYLMTFIEGATLAFYTGDQDEKRLEVAAALARFDTEFLGPSIERRRALLDQVANGTQAEESLPRDVLTALLRNEDDLDLPHDHLLREVAFHLLAGAHTSATAFTRVTHNILKWLESHPEDRAKVQQDRVFIQHCTHETIRLQPSSPTGMRWALADVELADGTTIPKGSKVVLDLLAVNRDVSVFGDDAADFDPYRVTPDGVPPYGLSFGFGMHRCIGEQLAAGQDPVRERRPSRS